MISIMALETGVNSPFANEIEIYPNPASDALFILLVHAERARCEIVNIAGELIYSEYLVMGKNRIEIGDFNSGIYLVKIVSKNQVISKKIIKRVYDRDISDNDLQILSNIYQRLFTKLWRFII